MTFEEFQRSGVDCEDLSVEFEDSVPVPGRIYDPTLRRLYIQRIRDGRWFTLSGNQDILTPDLAEAERFLYDAEMISGEEQSDGK